MFKRGKIGLLVLTFLMLILSLLFGAMSVSAHGFSSEQSCGSCGNHYDVAGEGCWFGNGHCDGGTFSWGGTCSYDSFEFYSKRVCEGINVNHAANSDHIAEQTCGDNGVIQRHYADCNSLDKCYAEGDRDYTCSSGLCVIGSEDSTCNSGCAVNDCNTGQVCQDDGSCRNFDACVDTEGYADSDEDDVVNIECGGTDECDSDASLTSKNACGVCAAEPSNDVDASCSVGVGACQRTGSYQCSESGTTCQDANGDSLKAGTKPQSKETSCSDGLDNDCDGQKDCADTDCSGTNSCGLCNNNGVCEIGENPSNCPNDCSVDCGDGFTTHGEDCELDSIQPVLDCKDGSTITRTCAAPGKTNECEWEGSCDPNICDTNSDCNENTAPLCSGKKTIDRNVGGWCNPGGIGSQCVYDYSCVVGSCNAECSKFNYANAGTGSYKSCSSSCTWNSPVTCTDADGDGYYAESYYCANKQTDCDDSKSQFTTSCPGGVVSPQPPACTCTDGVKNCDEVAVDCGGSCVNSANEICDGLDNDRDCAVDEGGVCTAGTDHCSGISDPDNSQACCESRKNPVTGEPYVWAAVGEPDVAVEASKEEFLQSSPHILGQYFTVSSPNEIYLASSNKILKYDGSGNLQWEKDFSLNLNKDFETDKYKPLRKSWYDVKFGGSFILRKLIPSSDGVVMVGTLTGTSDGTWEGKSQDSLVVAKFSPSGSLSWVTYWRDVNEDWRFGVYSTTGYTVFEGISSPNSAYKYSVSGQVDASIDASGDITVVGNMIVPSFYNGRPSSKTGNYIVKISSRGDVEDSNLHALIMPFYSEDYATIKDIVSEPGTDNNYVVAQKGGTYVLSKITSTSQSWSFGDPNYGGATQWTTQWTAAFDSVNNKVVVVGGVNKNTGTGNDYGVRIHNPSTGAVENEWTYDSGSNSDDPRSVIVDSDGEYIVGGANGVVKFDSSGNVLWTLNGVSTGEVMSLGDDKYIIGNNHFGRPLSVVSASVPEGSANPLFNDDLGEHTALPVKFGQFTCIGDDGELPVRFRERGTAGVTNTQDRAVCDKKSDCVFNGVCYSDIDRVAKTFFDGDRGKVLASPWKTQVSANIDSDPELEICDPGEWFDPEGSLGGTVTDSSTGLGILGATVSDPGETYVDVTDSAGNYLITAIPIGTYSFTASATGYDPETDPDVNITSGVLTTRNFALDPSTATVSGFVRDSDANPIAGALVRIADSVILKDETDATGFYSIPEVLLGFYDFISETPGDVYEEELQVNKVVVAPTTTIDFTMSKPLGSCTDQCTLIGSNVCDPSCNGRGQCLFYSEETKTACDGTFGLIELPGGRFVDCCTGKPFIPVKADVTVSSDNVVVTKKPVLYKGKFVNMVMVVFDKP